VLGRGHCVAVGADEVAIEALERQDRVVGNDLAPELGAEARNQIDAAHRCSRLAQRRNRAHEFPGDRRLPSVELEVGVRRRPEREDPTLRRAHPALIDADEEGEEHGRHALARSSGRRAKLSQL
jgi:hypothetical protein